MEAIPLIGAATGIGMNLFGGSSGNKNTPGTQRTSGQSTQQSSSAPINTTLPWFSDLGQTAAGGLGNFINQGPQATYGGPLFAHMQQREWDALGATQSAALDPIRRGLIQATQAGHFLPGQPGGNPFLESAIGIAQRPTAEALQHAVGRQIPGMFAAAGHQAGQGVSRGGSTAKDLNTIRAAEVGGRALGDIAGSMSNQAYQFERGMQQGAVGLGQQDIQALIQNLQAQGLPRSIEELGINRAITQGQQAVGNWLQGLQVAGGLPLQSTGNVSAATGQSTQSGSMVGQPAGQGMLTGLFGNQGVFPGLANAYGQNSIFGTAPRLGTA